MCLRLPNMVLSTYTVLIGEGEGEDVDDEDDDTADGDYNGDNV